MAGGNGLPTNLLVMVIVLVVGLLLLFLFTVIACICRMERKHQKQQEEIMEEAKKHQWHVVSIPQSNAGGPIPQLNLTQSILSTHSVSSAFQSVRSFNMNGNASVRSTTGNGAAAPMAVVTVTKPGQVPVLVKQHSMTASESSAAVISPPTSARSPHPHPVTPPQPLVKQHSMTASEGSAAVMSPPASARAPETSPSTVITRSPARAVPGRAYRTAGSPAQEQAYRALTGTSPSEQRLYRSPVAGSAPDRTYRSAGGNSNPERGSRATNGTNTPDMTYRSAAGAASAGIDRVRAMAAAADAVPRSGNSVSSRGSRVAALAARFSAAGSAAGSDVANSDVWADPSEAAFYTPSEGGSMRSSWRAKNFSVAASTAYRSAESTGLASVDNLSMVSQPVAPPSGNIAAGDAASTMNGEESPPGLLPMPPPPTRQGTHGSAAQ